MHMLILKQKSSSILQLWILFWEYIIELRLLIIGMWTLGVFDKYIPKVFLKRFMLVYIAQAMWDFSITLPEFKFKLFYDFNGWGAISFFFFNLFFKIIKAMEHFHQLVMIFSLIMIVFIKDIVKWPTYDKVSQQVQSLLGSLLNKMTLWFTSYYRYVSLFVVKPYSILLVLVNKKKLQNREL